MVLNKYNIIFSLCFVGILNVKGQIIEKNTKEIQSPSLERVKQLYFFLESKEFKIICKKLYHENPDLNYYNCNLNFEKSCLSQTVAQSSSVLTNDTLLNSNDFWSNSSLLKLRKWNKKSKFYLVFTKPQENILSFYIIRISDFSIESKLQYMSKTQMSSNSLFFSVQLNTDGYKLLCWQGGVKG